MVLDGSAAQVRIRRRRQADTNIDRETGDDGDRFFLEFFLAPLKTQLFFLHPVPDSRVSFF